MFLKKQEFLDIKLLYLGFQSYDIRSIKEARLVKYKLGQEISMNLYNLKCIISKKSTNIKIKNTLQEWLPPNFPIDGNDLRKIGLKKGSLLGQTLKETKAWWIDKDFKPNKKQCLNKSKEFLVNSREL